MNGHFRIKGFLASMALLIALTGCQPQQPKFLFPKGNIASQYIEEQTRIEYPDVCVESLDDVVKSLQPLSLDNPDPKEEWQLTLDEVRQMALDNSKILRELQGVSFSAAGVAGNPSLLLSYPSSALSVWDPAIIESNPQGGVSAALSAFDAIWSSTVAWESNELANNTIVGGLYGTKNEAGTFQTSLSKVAATGGTFYGGVGAGYDWNDSTNRTWGSDWTSYLEGGFSQPLLRGAGVEFNRIAGPNATVGSYNGVMIARIQTDIELASFEIGVRDFLKDLEETYWNLYYAYRNLNASGVGLDAALQSWRTVKAQFDVGHAQGTTKNIAQAEQNYQRFKVSVQEAQSNLYKNERLLRYMIGLAPTDGRLIKPVDEPTIARVKYNWDEIEAEALSRTPELRQQKWTVKKRELELIASRNFLMPSLNMEGKYRFHGMGHDLIDSASATRADSLSNAIGNATHDGKQNWGLGMNLEVPVGFRREMAGVRNAELLLSRERAILQEQELELVHNLSDLYADLDRTYRLIEDYLAVLRAARKEVRAVQSSFDVGKTTLFEVLDAQQKLADAETSYYRMVIDYNLAIMKLNYRKGSLLEYNGVTLAEGPWPAKAYFDANTRARERDAGHYLNRGATLPQVVSRGTYPQIQGTDPTIIPAAADPANAAPSELPLSTPATNGHSILEAE